MELANNLMFMIVVGVIIMDFRFIEKELVMMLVEAIIRRVNY